MSKSKRCANIIASESEYICKEIKLCPELSAMSASNAVLAQILAPSEQSQKATANTLSIPSNASIAARVKTAAPSAQSRKRN